MDISAENIGNGSLEEGGRWNKNIGTFTAVIITKIPFPGYHVEVRCKGHVEVSFLKFSKVLACCSVETKPESGKAGKWKRKPEANFCRQTSKIDHSLMAQKYNFNRTKFPGIVA